VLFAAGLALRGLREHALAVRSHPQDAGAVAVPGLLSRVTVHRDGRGVPHIVARSEVDAYGGLGFVHAQDRLGQMLWLRQQARGRTAETLGAVALPADREARTLGFVRLAEAQWEGVRAGARERLEAYAAGVNARIERIRRGEAAAPARVREFGLPLDPWTPIDTLALYKQHAWSLDSSVEATVVLTDLIRALGPEAAGRFFPGAGLRRPPAPAESTASTILPATPGESGLLALRAELGAVRRALGLDGYGIGSSAWVVGGAHTESGAPIVASDHHLPPTWPALFHLDHIRAEELDVAGATLPGVPVFWSGHNASVAWGSVSAGAVVTDLYVETLHPSDPTRYHDGRRWRDLRVREESLGVAGGSDEVFEVRETFRGPLLPPSEGREPVSVAWPGADPDARGGIEALLEVARARDGFALVNALEEHHEPVLAFAYADSDGAAGLQVAGWIPRRSLSSQLQSLPGRARYYHWEDRVPSEALPSARLLDGQGWLVAADASLAARAREPVDWLWKSGARAQRIEDELAKAAREAPIDLRVVSRIQTDVRVERSRRIAQAMTDLVAETGTELGPQAQEMAELLTSWDGEADAASPGAAAYHVWLHPLAEALLAEAMGPELWRRYVALPQTEIEPLVLELIEQAAAGSPDGARARQVADLARRSLRDAWLTLSYRLGANKTRWTWGRLHRLRFRPFAQLGSEFDRVYPYGGAASTVAAAAYDPLDPFDVDVASMVRFAFDAGSLDQSLALLAPGQSEHPGHPHADDQLAPWLEGRSALLATGPLLIEETRVARLVLEPVR
jgi:penicillin amidase